MTYTIEIGGSHNRHDIAAPTGAISRDAAIQALLGAMLDIYEADKLAGADAQRAFEFWTPDEIRNDLETADRCDIVICGGFYVLTAKKA
jgi:hypothetical protein